MIRAFHCLKVDKEMPDYNILTMILSALMWRKNMGSIVLYLDETTYSFVKKYNLDIIYDSVKIIDYLDIDYRTFWAGNKIMALKEEKTPIVMIDTDMIVFKDISYKLDKKIVCAHSEPIIESIYKEKDYFDMRNDYVFDYDFDWSTKPSNTAFLYINDEEFKNYYCKKSMDFMLNANKTDDNISYMVFAEQRMISMCAKQKKIDIKYIIDFPNDIGNQDEIAHIWGYKGILQENIKEQERFCKRCVSRIVSEFSDIALFFLHFDFMKKYI